jgi:hypothetical protein
VPLWPTLQSRLTHTQNEARMFAASGTKPQISVTVVVDPAVNEVLSRCLYKQTLLVLAEKIPFKLDIIDFILEFILDIL